MYTSLALPSSTDRRLSCRAAPPTLPELRICDPVAPARRELEAFIAGVFHRAYGAQIATFMPLLVGLQDGGSVAAALGLRSAAGSTLFCEQYLERPVEHYSRAMYGASGDRRRIMELGNLAVTRPGHSGILYLVITAALRESGVDYLLFAANRSVRRSIARCGFSPRTIRTARPESLPDGGRQWGSYYASQPVVMLGDVAHTLRQASQQPQMVALLTQYAGAISQLARAMEGQRT